MPMDPCIVDLHSTMYLLNLAALQGCDASEIIFTFHYVSIKSIWRRNIMAKVYIFTFHYVSIKSQSPHRLYTVCRYLHSTMYLLNRQIRIYTRKWRYNLHSTMYLLNRISDIN